MTPPAPDTDATTPDSSRRVIVRGKFLHLEGHEEPWHLRGICYGPFAPDAPRRVESDFAQIAALGFNTVRLYEVPDAETLHAAETHGLRLLCGIPWTQHVDFLTEKSVFRQIESTVSALAAVGRHPCVAALLIGNEIEKTLVRWMRPRRVRAALELMIDRARATAPQALISYATYPSTEYLVPRNADFLAVNVYLEQREDYTRYLARLHNLAGNKPLLITELGLDTAAHGVMAQADALRWFHEENLLGAAAGGVWFSFTDEWWRGGAEITDWAFGITTRERKERPACTTARCLAKKLAPPAAVPRISVIVCTRNGARTLQPCLESLLRLNDPDFEVLLIDDGSTDDTARIAQSLPGVRYHRKAHAGLSAARNRGMEQATGEILAYTDDDCVAHADWLLHLRHAFVDEKVIAAGGPNIPPPPRGRVERVVAAAPGAPAHVLLSDTEAEHLPGCNLAIRKDALAAIGGFHTDYIVAGDDVDICWRLREHGGRGCLRYVPGAMVWHHRRLTVGAYLKQQRGYGDAEALLMAAHSQRFGPLGGARWRGGIYGEQLPADDPREGSIYHGPLGLGAFQTIYAAQGGFRWWDWFTGVLWLAVAALALVCRVKSVALLLLIFALWASWRVSSRNARLACLHGFRDRALLWLLSFLQPVVREAARLRGMIRHVARPSFSPTLPEILPPLKPRKITLTLATLSFWNAAGRDRHHLLEALGAELMKQRRVFRQDDGWRWLDLEIKPQNEVSQSILTVTEYHGAGRCLTRVRCQLRISRAAVWNLLLWLAFAVLLSSLTLPLGYLGITALALTLISLPIAIHRLRRDLIRLVTHAADTSLKE